MMRWFVYIVMFLLITSTPSSAELLSSREKLPLANKPRYIPNTLPLADTIIKKPPRDEDDKKIKEVQRTKSQSKPAKIDDAKNQRERRPEGMERPPEIPRRNNN